MIEEHWAHSGLGSGFPEGHLRTRMHVIAMGDLHLSAGETPTAPMKDLGLRRLEELAQPGDLLLTFSVSDPSPQLQQAVAWANRAGLIVWALTAHNGGGLRKSAPHHLSIPLKDVGLVESIQLILMHWVGDDVSARLYRQGRYKPTEVSVPSM